MSTQDRLPDSEVFMYDGSGNESPPSAVKSDAPPPAAPPSSSEGAPPPPPKPEHIVDPEQTWASEEEEDIPEWMSDWSQAEDNAGGEAPKPDATGEAAKPDAPKGDEDENSAKYWQSQYDRTANELSQLKRTVDNLAPIADLLKDNPDAYARLAGQVPQQDAPVKPGDRGSSPTQSLPAEDKPPVRPQRPEKPQNYSRFDAESDPESESARYADALEEYKLDLAEWEAETAEFKSRQSARQEDEARQAYEQRQANALFDQFVSENYQMDAHEAHEFRGFLRTLESQPNFVDDMAKLFRYRRRVAERGNGRPVSDEDARRAIESQRRRSETPRPASTVGQSEHPQTEMSQEEAINSGLLNFPEDLV